MDASGELSTGRRGKSSVYTLLGSALLLLALAPARAVYAQTTFTVNSPLDLVDAALGDPACDAGGGQCTLRAAIQQANATPGDDTIRFDAALNGVPITLTIPPIDGCPPQGCYNEVDDFAGDLDIFESLTIAGNGPANTILQAGPDADSAVDRVFEIISPVYTPITTRISGVTVQNSGGLIDHGGIFVFVGASITTITDSVIKDNRGGGINRFYGGDLFLDRVTVSGNRAASGGGISAVGSGFVLSISNSTVTGNTADDGAGGGQGGGLYIDAGRYTDDDTAPVIVNSTFSGNLAAEGCAIYNADGFLRLRSVTVADNCAPGSGREALMTAADGEGVGTTLPRNSVIVSPTGVVNCRTKTTPYDTGTFTSLGYNLSSDASCGLAAIGDVQSTDPLLGPLGSNGGTTQTHLLLPGSPAIDTGTPIDCPPTDQRAFGRPVDGNVDGLAQCDRGSVEVAAALPPTTGTIQGTVFDDANGNGIRDGEAGLPAVQVCLFPTVPSLCTPTAPGGTYQFTGLAPGLYQVYAKVPAGRISTTPRSRPATVNAGGVVSGIEFGFQVPPPPPPAWVAPSIAYQRLGAPFPVRATPPCAAATVTATVVYAGLTVTQAMTNVGGNNWETFFLSPGGTGVMPVTIVASCAPEPFHGFIVFIDPSGTILDGCTGGPLAGATVTLLKNEPYGSATYVVPDPGEHLPGINPDVTTADGLYAWDVVPGRWRIRASRPGYDTVTTDPFDVPPPKLGLDITLDRTGGCNTPPVANEDAASTDQGTPVHVPVPGVLGNDTDPDDDPLTAVLVTSTANGTVALGGDGSFTYTPDAGFQGTDTFTYKANDGTDDSNVARVTITVRAVNRPPVARNDAYSTRKNRPLIVPRPGVLANDADPEGAALTAVLVRRPSHGVLLLSPHGSLLYQPRPGFVGRDSFTYKASEGGRSSGVATVTIDVTQKRHRGHRHHHDDDDCDGDDGRDHRDRDDDRDDHGDGHGRN